MAEPDRIRFCYFFADFLPISFNERGESKDPSIAFSVPPMPIEKSKISDDTTLSLFPLPVVQFPSAFLPLHIFEERYKQMIGECIDNDRPFGVVFIDTESIVMEPSSIGCSTMISKVVKLPRGRINILTVGIQRFETVKMLEREPFLRAEVRYFNDDKTDVCLDGLVDKVKQSVKDLLSLSTKLMDKEVQLLGDIPDDAEELSFWVAANFYASAPDQEKLLEMVDTSKRLKEEFTVLDGARKRLAAKVSLKNALG